MGVGEGVLKGKPFLRRLAGNETPSERSGGLLFLPFSSQKGLVFYIFSIGKIHGLKSGTFLPIILRKKNFQIVFYTISYYVKLGTGQQGAHKGPGKMISRSAYHIRDVAKMVWRSASRKWWLQKVKQPQKKSNLSEKSTSCSK